MQDGAPPHFVLPVREWLENIFPDLWIGRGGKKKRIATATARSCFISFLLVGLGRSSSQPFESKNTCQPIKSKNT